MISMQPDLRPRPDTGRYQLLRPYHFKVGTHWFEVPVHYLYDGASIPSAAWRITYSPFDPVVMAPALCHDYLCDTRPDTVSSIEAAKDFYNRLIANGADPKKAKRMWRAVELFGPQWG